MTSFATLLALPVFAFAMTVMKESSVLAASGERGRLRSLLRGVFASTAVATALLLAVSGVLAPRFAAAMKVSDASAGFLAVSAALLGCVAPVYTDALQSLKRFAALAAVELGGAVCRLGVLVAAMPLRALAGYFAGQAALPLFRIAASVYALRLDLAVRPEPFWTRDAVRRVARAFALVLVYQAVPMGAAVLEQSLLRTSLPAADSAGYYMASRFSDFLHYLSYPLLLVMFPYTATAAKDGKPVRPYVLSCTAATFAGAAALAAVYALFGESLISLLPNGPRYAGYAGRMPLLVLVTTLTTGQVFATNAEVSAGRFGFLRWFVPLHLAYAAVLCAAARLGFARSLDGLLILFLAASAFRFAFAIRQGR